VDNKAIEATRYAELKSTEMRLNNACPVCGLTDGFHDDTTHTIKRDVPRELIKENGWHRSTVSSGLG